MFSFRLWGQRVAPSHTMDSHLTVDKEYILPQCFLNQLQDIEDNYKTDEE